MCYPASFVLTKKQIFWSETSESHEDIFEEHGLSDGPFPAIKTVRVEITPRDFDFRTPIDTWKFKVDQDFLPYWFDLKDAEERTRRALPAWLASKINSKDLTTMPTDKVINIGKVQNVNHGILNNSGFIQNLNAKCLVNYGVIHYSFCSITLNYGRIIKICRCLKRSTYATR